MHGHDEGLEKWIQYEMRSIKEFFHSGYSFMDIAGELNSKGAMRDILSFSFGIEYERELFVYDNATDEWVQRELPDTKGFGDKYNKIEEHFLSLSGKKEFGYKTCRQLAGIKKTMRSIQEKPLVYQVYYMILFDVSQISPVFIHCFEAAYYKWLSACLFSASKEQNRPNDEEERRKLKHDVLEKFREYMLENIGIDLDVITALSSLYYEGQSCASALVFLLSDGGKRVPSDGIAVIDAIECKMENIGKIRKLLQTGTEKYSLLIYREAGNWLVKGLYQTDKFIDGNIIFRIRSHMVWNMEVGKRLAVCYKCGKYCIESKDFEQRRLEAEYKKVFGKEATEEVKSIFSEAMNQKHGTVLIVIQKSGVDDDCIKEEVKRLVDESAGIAIMDQKLEREFVQSLTAIDGALVIDDTGRCYGFAMILDGTEKLKGNPARGARFNSTRRYIKTCKVNGLKALGVVVSEDGMVDIFTTDDGFEGDGKNDTK